MGVTVQLAPLQKTLKLVACLAAGLAACTTDILLLAGKAALLPLPSTRGALCQVKQCRLWACASSLPSVCQHLFRAHLRGLPSAGTSSAQETTELMRNSVSLRAKQHFTCLHLHWLAPSVMLGTSPFSRYLRLCEAQIRRCRMWCNLRPWARPW